MTTRSTKLIQILEELEQVGDDDTVTVGALVLAIGHVSFAPLLVIPAVALVTPLSGIPLFSSVMGIMIFLVSVQMLFRREHLWLPAWLLKLTASRARVQAAFRFIRPVAGWLDRRTHTRLTLLTHRPLVFIPQLLCVLSGLFLPLLEFVPFSSSLVGVAIALLGIGMMARDGAIVFLAVLPYLGVGLLTAGLLS